MTRTSKLIAVGVALLALTACGSAKPKTAAAVSSPTPSTATVTQYASILNGPLHDFQKEWNTYQEQCVVEQNDFMCNAQPITINAAATLVQATIDNATDQSSRIYVGPPPAELATLVLQTRQDVTKVIEDTKDVEHLSGSMSFDCNALSFDVDRWGPYLS